MWVLFWIVSGGAISILGFLSWRAWNNYQKYKSLRSLPSPQGNWLLGNVPQLLEAARENKFFSILSEWRKDYGPMYVFWIARRPTIVLSKPKIIEEILTQKQKDLTFAWV